MYIYICLTETKEAQLIFNQKNTFTNHGFEDVEDSHFLFYFAIMTVLSMLFYLALYNKKKVSIQFSKLHPISLIFILNIH